MCQRAGKKWQCQRLLNHLVLPVTAGAGAAEVASSAEYPIHGACAAAAHAMKVWSGAAAHGPACHSSAHQLTGL